MNTPTLAAYPDVDAAAVKWADLEPRFHDWQDQQIFTLCKYALNALYDDQHSDSFKRGYSKTIFHAIQNIVKTKAKGNQED